MNFNVIIPARLHSTRLPEKVLLDIAGKPMIQHVYECAKESGADRVVIATDHEKIAQVAEEFGAPVCMTASTHQSGTERIAEAVVSLGFEEDEIIVGLQADEPCMPPQLVSQLAHNLAEHDHVRVATLSAKLKTAEELFNPNVVKVILNYRNYALYFSRAPMPWDREQFSDMKSIDIHAVKLVDAYFRHIGLYAYRAGFLETYSNWSPSLNEKLESLEQLRILWNGYKIHVGVTDRAVPAGVDTQADLERVRQSI
ncbi:MAG: 3-deoxy-manno-octulosonate cytidylyltransferase [Gammaproteobacteria bacterium RIFCSPHIGHO2_02_FULL_39_13]|nr:MAG: 3-deoxy-manno-octulosonate cytidylyltransferase [Gammaproteobacteria bacterium RIFCSPHIGHO2_02_FULL_39_13]OGT49801.1 MAG: 3-deoxy-manno-octulosonate cytidylyltransferase [Gammaproteobacteria bacterium RIFCSPHIGHO2_12_FULL_39_24]